MVREATIILILYTVLVNEVKDKKILLLVHGYNNDFNDVIRAYAIIEQNLNSIYDEIIAFSWPGGDNRFDYHAAKCKTSSLSPITKNIFDLIAEYSKSFDIMAHSMGVRLAIVGMENMKNKIGNIYTMGAAIDNEEIHTNERFGQVISKGCNNFYVFYSKKDSVLKFLYKVAELDNALGNTGPEDICKITANTSVINCTEFVKAHGDYKYCDKIYNYIKNPNSAIALIHANQIFSL
jgi:esterase/lipase superfamily enzyme